ncbi:MAG: PKD domain-containing protein [Bacteroidota bacterium]
MVDFTNTSQQATTYFWDFGDGNTSTAASPQHTYTDPGIYTVQLIVSDGICADTLIRTDEVEVVGPSADFSVNIQTGCSPLPVEFSDMSTADAGASLTNWIWDFGDGGSGLGPNPTYTYNAPGDYTVSLTVVDSRGCVDSISKVSFVQPTFPTADFTSADTLTCPGSLVQFQNLSVGNGISSVWDFGDGSPTSNATHPVHLFPNSGSFTITLSVTDANGCTDVRVQSSFINIGKPDAAFTADNTSSTCPPLLVNFRDLSSSDVVSWLWDFGDGSTSNLRSPSKIYTTAAQFDVQLIVTNSVGCRDTLLQEDFIEILGPNGSFTFTPLSGCQPLDVNFTVDSPNPNWTYGWDFGDGTGANGTNVVHTYVTDTLANPILLVEDQNGCIVPVTANNDIWIQPLPNPNFTVDYTDLCLGQTANFSNTSTSERSIADYFWDFGDGNSSTAINPSHTYADTGTYVVSLRATTIDGCVDTSSTPVIIRVTTPPSAAFTVSSIKDCVPFPVAFADASTGNFPLIRWEWDFGDGDQDNGQFISPHTYDSAGTFTATLLVTDSRGCTGNVSRNITVDPLPNVDFSAFQYGCAPITVSFQDLSSSAAGITDWAWQFGDGQLSTVDNPTNLYAADGFYTVSLQVTDGNGCINSLTRTDYIQLEHPTANFTSNAGITCPPQSVQFTDLSSSSSSISWRWDFGDGTSYSNQQNPFHVYQGTDTFDVELIVTDVYGCRDTMLRPAHVITYEPPTASFTLSDSIACVPQTVTFASTSSTNGQGVPLVSYQWNFGAGSGPVSPNTSHAFTSVGTHQVSLAISDGNGCRDTAYKIVQILPNPVADLSADQTNACAPIAIQFTDESNTNPFPVQWEWDFGDGNVSTVRNPINTYLSDGTYTVNLKIQDANGCRDSITYTNYISLDHPEADFTSSTTQICPGVQMQFFDQSTGPRPLTTRIWDFGDGTVVNNALNPTHIYTTPGTYTVSLIVGDGVNCRDTMIQTTLIEVVSGPTAQYAATPGQDCRPMTVAFSDLSTAGATPIVNWQWDFDNGTGSVSASPTQTFPVAGLYDVRLTVTDANGCVASYTDQVEALQTPLVDFTSDTRVGCAPQGIQFTDLTQTSYIKTAFYWDFGDGNTSTAQSPTHTYLADGAYTVSLRVTDQNGCTDSLEKVNYIKLSHPVANFSWNNNEVCPNTPVGVQFVDLSVPDTTLTSWVWDFGDGGTSSAQNPNYSYSTSGTYSIQLTITNVNGCTDTVSQSNLIRVLDPPVSSFTMSDSVNCAPLAINFTETSQAGESPLVSWRWDFGNGDSSLSRFPSYTWSQVGSYTVSLTTTDLNGCEHTASKTVEALSLPIAEFYALDTLGCAPTAIDFRDLSQSTYQITGWNWQFGDGNSLTNQQNPTHLYQLDGQYDVSLRVVDENGCQDSVSKSQYIRLSHPTAAFTASATQACTGTILQFQDLSTPDHPLISWEWDFGDGGTGSGANPTHMYTSPGQYDVQLVITNQYGCTDTLIQVQFIEILQGPTALFSPQDTVGCTPFNAYFLDVSVAGDHPIVQWDWDFSNGNTANTKDAFHQYTSPGTYTVSLTATDLQGCAHTYQRTVESSVLPTADFFTADSVGCKEQIDFTDISQTPYSLTGWRWDFGDGNTSNQQHPTHTYQATGQYTVSLVVTDIYGCEDSLSKPNYINQTRPQADFNMASNLACPGQMVSFTDASIPDFPIISWQWDFGDGAGGFGSSISHTWTSPGVYTVGLFITNSQGCTDSTSQTITIAQPPVASFVASDTAGCAPFSFNIQDLSQTNTSNIVGWQWDLGDGRIINQASPSVSYTQAGTYQLTLTVTDAGGCTDDTTLTIEVFDAPTFNFAGIPTTACAPQPVQFTYQQSAGANIVSWNWDFGDGTSSTLPTPSHTYIQDGMYDVSLTATDINGCAATVTKNNYINLRHPVANFTWNPSQACPGTSISFQDASIQDTTLNSWFWDFGDGNTSTLPNPSHTYSQSGVYSVSLTVTNVLGCSHTETKANIIEIWPQPTASFLPANTVGCAPVAVQFSNQSVQASAPIVGYQWDFGDGNFSTLPSPNQLFTQGGNFGVQLIALDANGCADTAYQAVNVNALPEVAFTASDSNGCAPVNIFFQDQSLTQAPITSWRWDFGDGQTGVSPSIMHTYAADGVYDVSLEITDANGCTQTLTKPQHIRLSHPVADFTSDATQFCPGTLVNFTDQSTQDTTLVNWLWDFGDGGTSTQPSPSHTYLSGGQYTVTLTVTNILGCSHTISRTNYIEVLQAPTPLFDVQAQQGCTPFEATFTDQSSGNSSPVVSWIWDFGDGDSSVARNPVHTFTQAGTYQVVLTTIDNRGCQASYSRQLTSLSLPVADFFSTDTIACSPVDVHFNDQSIPSYPITSWEWDFGDGQTSAQQHPIHTYTGDGNYDVRLVVTDTNGCTDTTEKAAYIRLTNPLAEFTYGPATGCPGLEVSFSDTSIEDTTLVSWEWDFGDGGTSFVQNPTHVYDQPGFYTVSLTITNAIGCRNTEQKVNIIQVFAPPVAGFSLPDTTSCLPLNLSPQDLSSGVEAPLLSKTPPMSMTNRVFIP